MSGTSVDLAGVLGGLKNFQRRTVDYVFRRMWLDDPPAHRFLLADEVGLGKTLVARGLIARTLHHLADRVERIDIVYVCSNAAIAQQNINRLNVLGTKQFALATRLTLLPAKLHQLARNPVNFVSFTPGTTFDLKSRDGRAEERVLLHRMLREILPRRGTALRNLLQGGKQRERWHRLLDSSTEQLEPGIVDRFLDRVRATPQLLSRLHDASTHFRRVRRKWPPELREMRRALVGELRHLLARVCVDALEPDLVILDEFQRFKDLLHGDNEAAQLAQTLMRARTPEGETVRTLLLSATPYRSLTFDDDENDNHYRDFVETLGFLFDDARTIAALEADLRRYRMALFSSDDTAAQILPGVRNSLRDRLLSVMVRTERVSSTAALDAMLSTKNLPAPIEPHDLHQARVIGRMATALGAQDPIEYWKSAPYVVHFMRDYDLRRRLDQAMRRPGKDLLAALVDRNGVLLRRIRVQRYRRINDSNGRLRALMQETVGRGMWRMLWIPPALPYTEPGDAYTADNVTKTLVFSAWNVVPDSISALISYEAERRMIRGSSAPLPPYNRLTKVRRPLLRFNLDRTTGRPTGMPILSLLYPCVTLAKLVDPLRMAAGRETPVAVSHARDIAATAIRSALERTGHWPGEGPPNPQWYWAALALLDSHSQSVIRWAADSEAWQKALSDTDGASRILRRHIERFVEVASEPGALGAAPPDLIDVLTDLALGSPAICALRALHRVAPDLPMDDRVMLQSAAAIANGFRTLYNLPETTALLRSGEDDAYWRVAAQHGIDGNLQSVLDEYVHGLRESLGLLGGEPRELVEGISAAVSEALSILPTRIKADDFQAGEKRLRLRSFWFRGRMALRFTELKDDSGKTLARAASVGTAFNSPFRPFVLATTSIGQEGLDFHPYCHRVCHWNLPSNPVDLEQREGRVHRYKGHAIRKNIARRFGLATLPASLDSDPWTILFDHAVAERGEGASDLVPYWVYPIPGGATVERLVPILPFSREVQKIRQLQRSVAVYRLAFGQPRQEDLMAYLERHCLAHGGLDGWRLSLEPPESPAHSV
jgi:hypothetical protein